MLHRYVQGRGLFPLILLFLPVSSAQAGVQDEKKTPPNEPLTRAQAVGRALEANPLLASFGREIEAARARRLQADGFEPPTLSWDFDEADRLSSPGRFGNQILGIEQSFEPVAARRARKEATAIGINAAEALLERAQYRVRARTQKAFDEALKSRRESALLERMAGLAGESVEFSRVRFRSGAASYVDFLRLRLRREQLQNEQRITEVNEAAALRELGALLGYGDALPAIWGDLESLDPVPEASAVLAGAEQRIPTLRVFEERRREAEKHYETARAGRFPEITVGIGRQRLYDDVSDYAWAGRLALRLPIPGSDLQQGREAEARAEMDRSGDRARAQYLTVKSSLGRRLDEAKTLERRVGDFRKLLLPDAEDQLKAAQQDYRVGRIDALSLTDVFATYVDIHREYLDALLRLRAAIADLQTLGEDLWELEQ